MPGEKERIFGFDAARLKEAAFGNPRTAGLAAAGCYLLFALSWLGVSRLLLRSLYPDVAAHSPIEDKVEWLWIGITAGLVCMGVLEGARRLRVAEERRRSSDAQLKSLVEASLVGVYIIRDGRFVYVNPRLAEMFGYTRPEFVAGASPTDLVAPQDRALVAENIRKRMQGEVHSLRYVFHGLRKDGKVIEVEAFGSVAELDGEPAIVGMLLDRTEHNLLQAELLHAQRMEVIGRVAAGIAHDFNNLLTAITGLTRLTVPTLPPEDQRRADLEEVLRCTDRAAALTRQLLIFSRKQAPEPRPVDLNALIKDAEPMLRRAAGPSTTLELALAQGVGAMKADPGQLEQVLLNLAVNARDAMANGGILEISTFRPDLETVALQVRDTGCGMDQATLSRLFTPFFTTKEPGKGTGLGLSVIHRVVEQSGGRIEVRSRPGEGTTFRILWPAEAGPSASPPEPAASPRPASGTERAFGAA